MTQKGWFFKICIFNHACYTSIFTIFKGPYVTYILYSSFQRLGALAPFPTPLPPENPVGFDWHTSSLGARRFDWSRIFSHSIFILDIEGCTQRLGARNRGKFSTIWSSGPLSYTPTCTPENPIGLNSN